jgi:ABC-2 type transport system ATP-binding protein
MPAIEITDLHKHYGATLAVDGLSFTEERGEIFGLLGPNGAGKTTTVEIAEGLRKPDSGQVRVLGLDVQREAQAVKRRIGVQLQTTALYPRLTVREVLELFSSFFDGVLRPVDELIDLVNLRDKEHSFNRDLSGGQRQRLSVALALVNKPELVFLDEPTTGLDPQSRRRLWETIRGMRAGGATVLLTTHSMEEAEVLCDRVAIVDAGKIIALDTPGRLIDQNFTDTALEFELRGALPPEGAFRELPGVTRPAVREGQHVTLYTASTAATLAPLLDLVQSNALHFDDLHIRRATLEDVFLKLTGRRIRE